MLTFIFACINAENPITTDMVRVEDGENTFYIDRFEYPNILGQKPTAHMSLDLAKAACAEVGKRLCTAQEWQKACAGSQNWRFGYGPTYAAGKCKSNTPLPSGHNSIKNIEESISKSGSLENCHNDFDIYDMIGNLEEWVLDDFNGRAGSLEGGAFYTYKEYADCSGRYSRQPDFRLTTDKITDSSGTRCCYRKKPLDPAELQNPYNPQPNQTVEYAAENEIVLESGVRIDQYEYPNQKGMSPLTNVTWAEANQLCEEEGKKLCSPEAWEEACSNHNTTVFPYGNQYDEQKCPSALQAPSTSGLYADCRNELGVHDLTGSVWEWVSQAQLAPKLNENSNESRYELRGGSWFTDSQKTRCRALSGYPLASGNARYPDVGFRCCRGESKTQSLTIPTDPNLKCPTGMAAAGTSCIDRYEFPNTPNALPKANVTVSEAQAFCRQKQKHLCTSAEWLTACEGPEGNRWAYGSQYDPSKCHHNAPDGLGKAQPTGQSLKCQTSAGVFDLTGNVWEWTMEAKMFGGSWNFSSGMGQCKASAKPEAGYHAPEIGFRCCATQKEAEALLQLETP